MKIADWVNVEDYAFVKIMFKGSGDPTSEHQIVGVGFCDSAGNILYSVGETRGEDRSEGRVPAKGATSAQ